MLTEFQRKKQAWYFHIVDLDRNAYIEAADWDALAQNLCALRGIPEGSEAYGQVMGVVGTVWENICKVCGVTPEGRIDLEQWLEFEDQMAVNCDEALYDNYVNTLVRGAFDVFDVNKDGQLSLQEWAQLYAAWRVEPRFAPEAFQKIDRDGNGFITKDELVQVVKEFHQSDDPNAPGNWLFGPIPEHV